MDYTQAFAISAVGMGIERARVDVAALNLANANTVQGASGTAYRPLRVVAEAGGSGSVSAGTDEVGPFGALVREGITGGLAVAPRVRIVATDVAPRMVYEPGHPLANERGFVAHAAVDSATEMISLMSATRAYEANVSAMNTSRTLALRTLDIGGTNA